MCLLFKTSLIAIGCSLFCIPIAFAQNWGSSGNYSQTVSGTTPQGRSYAGSVTTSYSQSYGAGGWMGTGCPNGVGWTIFGINAVRGMPAGAPVPVPVAAGAPMVGMAVEEDITMGGATEQESMDSRIMFRPTGRDGVWLPTKSQLTRAEMRHIVRLSTEAAT
jgi:hypothetical protein